MVANPKPLTEQPAQPVTPPPQPTAPLVSIDIYLSLALSVGAAGVSTLAIKKAVEVAKQINRNNIASMLPPRETRRVHDLLAQLGILARADRVVLGLFHNGHLSRRGFHMDFLAIPFCYERPGMASLPEFRRDIPVSEILREMESLWQIPSRQVCISKDSLTEENEDCRLYLENRNLQAVRLHLLASGTTEVALLGFHYQDECGWADEIAPTVKRIETELIDIARRASLQKPIWSNSPISRR